MKGIEVAISVATLVYNFFKDLYEILQFFLVSIGITSVITVAGATMFAVSISTFTWITKADIFWESENSQNKQLEEWVNDAKDGIIRKYNFEFKEGWDPTHAEKDIHIRKWTDYASLSQEFTEVFKYVGFVDGIVAGRRSRNNMLQKKIF